MYIVGSSTVNINSKPVRHLEFSFVSAAVRTILNTIKLNRAYPT